MEVGVDYFISYCLICNELKRLPAPHYLVCEDCHDLYRALAKKEL